MEVRFAYARAAAATLSGVVGLLVACGGTTAPGTSGTDASAHDASTDGAPSGDDAVGPAIDAATDAPGDAPAYLACMDATGKLDASLKTCASDADCLIEQEQTDCCGTLLYVGVSTASKAAFDACEASWLAHFPACGCDSGQTKTEDGKVWLPGQDASAPLVHCADFTSNGGICLTYTP
jgi:hypothetical protein